MIDLPLFFVAVGFSGCVVLYSAVSALRDILDGRKR